MSIKHIDAATQRKRLLSALIELGRVSSTYARETLNCYHPNARILELRKAGHKIVTHWETITDSFGRNHRVGVWVLLNLAKGGE